MGRTGTAAAAIAGSSRLFGKLVMFFWRFGFQLLLDKVANLLILNNSRGVTCEVKDYGEIMGLGLACADIIGPQPNGHKIFP